MNNHLLHMLRAWHPLKDDMNWVFGVIYDTEGSCYRKSGAMVLLSDMGHQLGVLSGGCLETDIQQNARRVMQDGRPRLLTYDDNDEDDIAFRLGIGCGGVVHLMLLPVNQANDYLSLTQVFDTLSSGHASQWAIHVTQDAARIATRYNAITTPEVFNNQLVTENGERWLQTQLMPPPHILIIGGGFDVLPVAHGAINLGWSVSVWDPRPAYARQEHFNFVSHIIQDTDASSLKDYVNTHAIQAVIMMSHHKDIDSKALTHLHDLPLKYIAMIGPEHRRQEIVERADIDPNKIQAAFVGPVGLDIGGDLPESIALSMLAECHAVLHAADAKSLSNIL